MNEEMTGLSEGTYQTFRNSQPGYVGDREPFEVMITT
jgi:hypothetical protein